MQQQLYGALQNAQRDAAGWVKITSSIDADTKR
jgi:hypothetical protein